MPNQKIFCNSPWYELNIYWDGGFGFCCAARHRVYTEQQEPYYNIKNMSIREWYNSEPMRQSRMMMFGDQPNSMCQGCYKDEHFSGVSRRYDSNLKSVIFINENFKESYQQSPGFKKFESSRLSHGDFDQLPIDLHIDLGNFCNLACKMCCASASSKIAVQEVKWGIKESQRFVGTDWTRDQATWNRFLSEVVSIPKLKNIHFMGGETLLTSRFEEVVDYMIQHDRFDLNFSFVTNGTVFNDSLMKKLTKFKRVGIEVSIETVTPHNSYQRQGTDTEEVLKNIERYLQYSNNKSITVTARPALSLLTIGNYDSLLRYCIEKNILIKSLLVSTPAYLDVANLPADVKQQYKMKYYQLEKELELLPDSLPISYNRSDAGNIDLTIQQEIKRCINLLESPTPADVEQKLKQMVEHCRRWDLVYNYNALDFYPELAEIFVRYGY